MTASQFARTRNIHPVTFCRWIRRASGTYSEGRRPLKTAAKASDFVAVKVVDDVAEVTTPDFDAQGTDSLAAGTATHTETMLEIILANKRMLRIHARFTPELLSAIVLSLEGC